MIAVASGNGKVTTEQKGAALFAAGRVVNLDDEGGSVMNDEGHVYRVDFALGDHGPHCQCKGFEHHGWCKHLVAIGLAYAATQAVLDEADEPDDGEWMG